MGVELDTYEDYIREAYKNPRGSNLTWLVNGMMLEAAEVAELIHKAEGYNKPWTREQLCDELGDVLNFLVAAAQCCRISMNEIMVMNLQKLEDRGYIKE